MKPVDIFITAYLRPQYTLNTLKYLADRTKYPYRTFVIDQGGNPTAQYHADHYISTMNNLGIHAAWNMALALAESEYFITSDNDIFIPDLNSNSFLPNNTVTENQILKEASAWKYEGDWLERMVRFMDERPDYGAISLHPHIFIGAAGIDPSDPEDVKERNMCGAVMRIMRTEAVRKAGGWEHKIEAGRNHEERTICSRLQSIGYKVGIATRIRAYHPFGKGVENGGGWGYPAEFPPEAQKHTPELKDYVLQFDNPDAYDNRTWMPL